MEGKMKSRDNNAHDFFKNHWISCKNNCSAGMSLKVLVDEKAEEEDVLQLFKTLNGQCEKSRKRNGKHSWEFFRVR